VPPATDLHVEGEDDEGIFRKAREHVAQLHSPLGLGDKQVRPMIAQGVYDVPARSA